MKPIITIEGTGIPLRGANIDTDRIIPARFLRTVSFDGLEQHAFEDDRAALRRNGQTHAFDDARFAGAAILLVNGNFGCGSSREHAPQALYRRGIRAVIGESFSEIFFGNAIMLGMPCVTASPGDVTRLQDLIEAAPATGIAIDLGEGSCHFGAAPGAGTGAPVPAAAIPIDMVASAREAFMTGAWDGTALLLDRYDEVERVAAALPYL